MKMKRLFVLSMVAAVAGGASAARNFILNGSFEMAFSNAVHNQYYDGSTNSYAYASENGGTTSPSHVPYWDGEDGWGYVWNPVGSGGTNLYGNYVGLTNVSHGAGAYGAEGSSGKSFRAWQRTNIKAEEGDTVILSWDLNFLSADYGVGAWFTAALQFVGADQVTAEYPNSNAPYDVWRAGSITQIVTAAEALMPIQIQINGAGVWIDNIRLEIFPANRDPHELLYNGSFELPFVDGYGDPYDPTVDDSYGYGGQPTFHLPGWNGEIDWGYAWNPAGSGGVNHWGAYVGLTNASGGTGAYGAWGGAGHYFSTWQNTETTVKEGDTAILSWDMNFLLADYGSSAWHDAHLQFVSYDSNGVYNGSQIDMDFPNNNAPYDVWRTHSITQVVTAAQAGSTLQVHFQGAGMWIDRVSLKLFGTGDYDGWIASFGLVGADAERGTDYEMDGMENLLEYVLGGNPTNADAAAVMPTMETVAGTMEYVYRRRLDAADRKLDYGLVLNTNSLQFASAWINVGLAFETASAAIDTAFESVTNTIPIPGKVGFVNLEVSEN